jgi:hypothetical protein
MGMLELTAALLVGGPVRGEPAPKPLLCNGQLGESLEIFVGGPGSRATHMLSNRLASREPPQRDRCVPALSWRRLPPSMSSGVAVPTNTSAVRLTSSGD